MYITRCRKFSVEIFGFLEEEKIFQFSFSYNKICYNKLYLNFLLQLQTSVTNFVNSLLNRLDRSTEAKQSLQRNGFFFCQNIPSEWIEESY